MSLPQVHFSSLSLKLETFDVLFQNYNVKPKPFGSGGFSNGLSAQTSQLNLGKDDASSDHSSSHGSQDLPPPSSLHAAPTNTFNPKPVSSFSAPAPWKPPAPAPAAKPSAPAAGETSGSVVLTPTQKALLEEEGDDDTPKRGATNRSRAFRMLQQQIDDGGSLSLVAQSPLSQK